jgi:hypothetical protein
MTPILAALIAIAVVALILIPGLVSRWAKRRSSP